ncbi:CBF/Mak21 family-domain-containing protein [Lipomyces oligophaga]|uniref:CBF/Mak21 family-domain-containing protein n=1 Tax=Lipomyces oligophaga TaxID=45792 RepID=UPI0034CE1E04
MPSMERKSKMRKRSRRDTDYESNKKLKKQVGPLTEAPEPTADTIAALERQIAQAPEYYNNLVFLNSYLKNNDGEIVMLSKVSLFRSFAKLMAADLLRLSSASKSTNPDDSARETLALWLQDRYHEFIDALLQDLRYDDEERVSSAISFLIHLIHEESVSMSTKGEYFFSLELFSKLVKFLLPSHKSDLASDLVEMFVENYVNEYFDIRYHFLNEAAILASAATTLETPEQQNALATNLLSALSAVNSFPSDAQEIDKFLVSVSVKTKTPILKLSGQKGALQDAWLALMKLPLQPDQYKRILQIMHQKIIPNINRPQLLMDFLTDSYDAGGATSLLALNALFSLMQKYNLDYPNFYAKLYALLDRNVMHVKYRSRFFRLLELFLSSTHLPAALVASFIKRMSRLSLSAPPSAIVIVIPFVYNLLKKHNTCNLMLQRINLTPEEQSKFGLNDPFDSKELDPNKSGALDSSLWELATLQSHYHPNVATLAKIMSEPFNKPSYNIEDFMDHSYSTMLDAEFEKSIRKPPAVEYEFTQSLFETAEATSVYLKGWKLY